MSFDINNQYTGKLFGQDRIGHTTPDLEASETLRPWLPIAYPAPYLPGLRQDQGHPKLANVVLSSQNLVGQDKSGALVPAGLKCGSTAAASNDYTILVYGLSDVGFAINPQTGLYVAAAGEHVVLAAPSDAVAGNVTLPNGTIVAVSAGDITFAHACNLFPTGVVRPIGCTLRNVLQYIGGIKQVSLTGGILFTMDGVVPTNYVVHNYTHEMGTAIQTEYVLRVPWIGATPNTLTTLAATDGVVGYAQGYGRTFTHFTGAPAAGQLVAASQQLGDAGNFTNYDSTKHSINDIVGRVIGVVNMINKIGFSNRVRTLWDPSRLVGPMRDPNPSSIMMGGSATGGIDYTLNLTTDAAFITAKRQGKTIHDEYGTYVLVKVSL